MYAAQQTNPGYVSGAFGIGAAAQAPMTEAAGRAPELLVATERLDREIANVVELVQRLDNRLTGTVARPAAPTPAETKGSLKTAMNTGLGSQLDAANDRLLAAALQMHSLLDRLEF